MATTYCTEVSETSIATVYCGPIRFAPSKSRVCVKINPLDLTRQARNPQSIHQMESGSCAQEYPNLFALIADILDRGGRVTLSTY